MNSNMYTSGLPDYIIIAGGIVHFWEFKRVGGVLSGQQRSTLCAIKRAGCKAYAIVGTSRNTMNVLDPPKFNTKMVLRKVNGHWEGISELLGTPQKETVEIDI